MKLRDFVPPVVYQLASVLLPEQYGWRGQYASWEEAAKKSSGYDAGIILNKVRAALLKVKNGQAAYERDSVLFDHIEYEWPLLSALLWSAAENGGELNVLDFGGSLGSTYFQYRAFYKGLRKVRWNVVEQENFVAAGKKDFSDEHLQFYSTIKECMGHEKPSLFLFSSVIQYMERPYELLKETLEYRPDYILIDKMPFLNKGEDIITLQRVDPAIYEASYPCWMLDRARFLNFFTLHYNCVAEFDSPFKIKFNGNLIPYQGFIFKKK